MTALNQKLFFSDVLCLEVPLYHHPTALQECEARMLVCSVGLMPARRNDHNHLHTVPIQLCTTHSSSLTVNLNNDNNNNKTIIILLLVSVSALSKAKKSLPECRNMMLRKPNTL